MKAKLLLLSVFVSSAALADDAALLHCRTIADVGARVACYDAIPLASAGGAATGTATVAAAPTPVARTPEQNFGLPEQKKAAAVAEEPKFIQSTIIGKFDGWVPNQRIHLANGQTWRIIDNTDVTLSPMDNPKVKVTRNFLGSLFLEIEGTNQSPRVKRVE